MPLFDEHYEVPSPPDAFYQVYIPVDPDDKKALVRFGPDGYQLHASFDALPSLNDYVNFRLADNDVIQTSASSMYVLRGSLRLSPVEHDVLDEYFEQVGMGGYNDDAPQYEIAGHDVTIHNDPFTRGTVHFGTDTTVAEAREVVDGIETALQLATG